ncbi:MAG: hypothetical protein K5899_03270 [Bacteroidaceae bacterium]|nr:hypothetical protein [Bacteroidaceae bacterium]
MEANELMVGDWLFYRGQFNAFSFRVEQITRKKVGYHAEPNECRMNYIRLSECQPVPLTVERLILIGFELIQNLFVLTDENRVFPGKIFIEYNLSNGCLYINDGLVPRPINYVHQLQHALILCGIEKEITIY